MYSIPNGIQQIQNRILSGRLTWKWPVVMVFARLVLAFLYQGIPDGYFMLQGNSDPLQAAAPLVGRVRNPGIAPERVKYYN